MRSFPFKWRFLRNFLLRTTYNYYIFSPHELRSKFILNFSKTLHILSEIFYIFSKIFPVSSEFLKFSWYSLRSLHFYGFYQNFPEISTYFAGIFQNFSQNIKEKGTLNLSSQCNFLRSFHWCGCWNTRSRKFQDREEKHKKQ